MLVVAYTALLLQDYVTLSSVLEYKSTQLLCFFSSTACNILMDDHEGVFTLSTRGDGVPRNCTLTTLLFAGNFQILESTMSGVRSGEEGPEAPVRSVR